MLRTRIAAAAVAGGLLILPLLAGPAAAEPRLDDARGRCLAGIDARLQRVDKLDERVEAARHLTDDHRGALSVINSEARSGLTELREKVEDDTDAATLRADCRSVLTEYRIYVLRTPQERLVMAADAETAAVARFEDVETRLADAIDDAEADGVDVTEARATLAELESKVDDAESQLDGVADDLLAVGPADYNADHEVLQPDRAKVKAAAIDLRGARDDARSIVGMLRDAE